MPFDCLTASKNPLVHLPERRSVLQGGKNVFENFPSGHPRIEHARGQLGFVMRLIAGADSRFPEEDLGMELKPRVRRGKDKSVEE